MDRQIRIAVKEDAKELLALYTPYVEQTAITFEYEAPTLDEFEKRIEQTLKKFPYLVAQQDGQLVGYAYAGPFRPRPAYDWAVETTIYIRQDQKKTGLGRELYQALENLLSKQHILNLYACIAYPTVEDEYLTRDSVHFHQRLGYRLVGEFYQCGYKFGRWYNMVWMEKHLGNHEANPSPVCQFN
ncbi:MAG: N-acetyltransferase family protein [Lachnospiraceae bacterium]|nr:N-acetyltransferase family protein [Lachnospiraceae bacterium]MDY3223596.1 N-acetyltransferase family protein [Lachnospiraceae bacterium]